MAYGPDKNRLILAEARIYIGTWATANLIGTNNVNFASYFGGSIEIGTIKRGTFNVNLGATYAEARTGTPDRLFRKDPTHLDFTIEFEMFEMKAEIWGLLQNREVQAAYPITIGPQNWDLISIGSDQMPIVPYGFLCVGRDVNGNRYEIGMYQGILTPEDSSFTPSGDDYVTMKGMIMGTPDPTFTTLAEDRRNLGYFARQNS